MVRKSIACSVRSRLMQLTVRLFIPAQVKCISCPVAYHLTTRCRPRDSQLLSTTLICCRECQVLTHAPPRPMPALDAVPLPCTEQKNTQGAPHKNHLSLKPQLRLISLQNPAISKPLEVNLTKCLFKPGSKKSSTKKRQLKILPQSQIKDGDNDDNDDKAEKQAVKRPKLISE